MTKSHFHNQRHKTIWEAFMCETCWISGEGSGDLWGSALGLPNHPAPLVFTLWEQEAAKMEEDSFRTQILKVDHRYKSMLKVRSRRNGGKKTVTLGWGSVRRVIKCTKRKKLSTVNSWLHIQKIKILVFQKSPLRKQEDNPQNDEKKIFANHTSDKELITF